MKPLISFCSCGHSDSIHTDECTHPGCSCQANPRASRLQAYRRLMKEQRYADLFGNRVPR